MVSFSDIIYHNLLKKAVIIVVILGLILGIFIVYFTSGWMQDFTKITETSTKACTNSTDCFEWCGECASLRDARVCPQEFISCDCINGVCQQT